MVKRYTRFVLFGKNILWILVALMLLLLVWIGSSNTGEGGARLVFTNIPKSEALQNVMMKPHYQGVDAHNKPYTITAEKGTQLDKNTVLLDTISADMLNAKGDWVALHAGTGEMHVDTKILELSGGVEIFYEGGYQFRSESAHIDVGKGTASGDKPIEGQGPAGTLTADSFAITGRGNIIRFNGSVRMLLYQ